jgi:hypothetical protein
MEMRKGMTTGAICVAFAAVVLLAQSNEQITPLNMKTGGWQTTMTGKYSGIPPQMAAAMNPTMTYKNCVKPADLSGHTWARDVVGKCSSVTVLKSTSTDADIEASNCQVGGGMTAEGRGTFHLADSEHLTGKLDITFSGNNPFGGNGPLHMHAEYTSQWAAATCPGYMQ